MPSGIEAHSFSTLKHIAMCFNVTLRSGNSYTYYTIHIIVINAYLLKVCKHVRNNFNKLC